MDHRDLLIQRYVDGCCDRAEAAVVEAWLAAGDPQVRQRIEAAQRLHRLLLAESRQAPGLDREDLAQRIIAAVPLTPPVRSPRIGVGQILAAALVVACVGLVAGLASQDPFRRLLDLALIAWCAMGLGFAILVLARPLRRLENCVMSRLLRRQIALNSADVLVYRVAGLAVVIGGLYLWGVG